MSERLSVIDGAVIFNNLDAYFVAYTNPPTMTEPGGEYYVVFYPSYFTDYGTAAVTRNGKFGIINTSGDIICDFIYDGMDIYYVNIAVIKDGGMQKFYYIDSGQESSFSATYIHPLQDGFFSFYTYGFAGEGLIASGVVDSYGNMMLPDDFLYINGVGKNANGQTIINPKGNATRAQVAAMLHRFITLIEK
jgi:hypothetical protein